MKLRLPQLRLPRLPLMPRWLATLAGDGAVLTYRLRLRWHGAYELLPATPPAGQPCIALIARSLPYRRKLQRFPDSPKARLALLRAAPDEFPLPVADILYGLGVQGHDGYLYALPRTVLTGLQEHGLQPAIVLIGGDTPEAAGCLAAVDDYLRLGAAVDLLRSRRFLSRRRLLLGQLGAALLFALFAAGWLLATPDLFVRPLEWRAARLREQGSDLPALYRVTEKMAYTQAEAAKLYARPEARVPGLLARLFASVPAGCSLRSVEVKNAVLTITGDGANVREWLIAQGFPPERISAEAVGGYQRFRAERPL